MLHRIEHSLIQLYGIDTVPYTKCWIAWHHEGRHQDRRGADFLCLLFPAFARDWSSLELLCSWSYSFFTSCFSCALCSPPPPFRGSDLPSTFWHAGFKESWDRGSELWFHLGALLEGWNKLAFKLLPFLNFSLNCHCKSSKGACTATCAFNRAAIIVFIMLSWLPQGLVQSH